jgi:hypothetical protein
VLFAVRLATGTSEVCLGAGGGGHQEGRWGSKRGEQEPRQPSAQKKSMAHNSTAQVYPATMAQVRNGQKDLICHSFLKALVQAA